MNQPALWALSFAFWSATAAAQTPIYESKGPSGPVFSDQPASGAQRVELPPPNVIETPQPSAAAPAPQKASGVAPAPYGRLAINSPANGSTLHSNDGAISLQLQVQPALRAGAGDRIVVRLDGKPLAKGYSSATIAITPADWARAAGVDTVEHSLQVAIVDRSGVVLIESAPVRFFVQRATQGGARVTPHAN